MEFEHLEYTFSADGAGQARRIASLLAEQGYQSLYKEALDLFRRYLPGGQRSAPAVEPLVRARTVDLLIPPADPGVRILVCERPAAGVSDGAAVAVVAVARSREDAHRSRTAVKLALDTTGAPDNRLAAHLPGDNGRVGSPRFRKEWARALGLAPADRPDAEPSSTPRPLASAQALFTLQGAPSLLGRPSVLRSRLDKGTDSARAAFDPALLDGLVTGGLVDRAFVLMCRGSGQIVGIGKDAEEVQAAMQLTLRCPHCRRPLSEEGQDVLYSLSSQGEEFIRSTRWMREAVESSLRARNCDAVVLAEAPNGRVDGAACYRDAVLLFRLKGSAPAADDVRTLREAAAEFEKVAPGVPVRSAIVTSLPAPLAAAVADGETPCSVLDVSRIEEGLDRLLDDVSRDAFARLTGTTLEFIRLDPRTLLSHATA